MQNLEEIREEQLEEYVGVQELSEIQRLEGPKFVAKTVDTSEIQKNDPLVDIEITLRKGERIGFFSEIDYDSKKIGTEKG